MTISVELQQALESLSKLDGSDFLAIASWMKQEGREALRARGANDNQIGPCRMDIDRFNDAPLG
mgnify:CR=1 FL=1